MATTALSGWTPFYMVDLELDGVDLDGALDAAEAQASSDARFDIAGLEKVLRAGLANGGITGDPQEGDVADEFYHDVLGAQSADSAEMGVRGAPPAAVADLPDAVGVRALQKTQSIVWCSMD